jgi:hypothetical protein
MNSSLKGIAMQPSNTIECPKCGGTEDCPMHAHDWQPKSCSYGGETEAAKHDPVNHPKHYTNHPSGVECIQITRHMGFNLGNAMKYVWRADLKNGVEDLEKAIWYIKDEIAKRRT